MIVRPVGFGPVISLFLPGLTVTEPKFGLFGVRIGFE